MERVSSRGPWGGLNDARARIRLRQSHQCGQAFAAHDAVGIEHDHVAVTAAPTPAKIGDIAALVLDAVLAQAIEDAPEASYCSTQIEPCVYFGDSNIGIAAVGEHKKVEAFELSRLGDRFIRSAQPGEDGTARTLRLFCALRQQR